ncbi:MAG TPA: SMI1/KNR4 family protein, partial [Allocoleopsis sp.]
FLESNVLGTAILLDNAINPSLLYGFTVAGEFRFYWGQPPLEHSLPSVPGIERLWPCLPWALRNFYTSVHNGWTCFHVPMNSMGPLPLQNCFFLSEERLDITDAMATALPFNPSEVLAVFSNGMGDYLCLDTNSLSPNNTAKGVIWWHEKPMQPWVDLDFWTVMGEWMSIYLETADSMNSEQ